MKARVTLVFGIEGLISLTQRQPLLIRSESSRQDTRFSYGEDRYQLIGRIEERLFVLVYTPRHDAIRIISARKANAREVKRYENRSHDD